MLALACYTALLSCGYFYLSAFRLSSRVGVRFVLFAASVTVSLIVATVEAR